MSYSRSMLGLVLGFCVPISSIVANPSPASAAYDAGAVTLPTHASSHMTITQHDQRAVINWQDYQVQAGESIDYQSGNPAGVYHLLNRISGNSPAFINGTITSSHNQILYFVSPNGLVVGPSGTFNVGGLLLSGLDISRQDFLNNQMMFHRLSGTSAHVINSGNIIASMAGIVMQGSHVVNHGTITASANHVHLTAGDMTTVTFDPDGLFEIAVKESVLSGEGDAAIENTGELSAKQGTVNLDAHVASNIFSYAVNNTGVIEAHGVSTSRDGVTILGQGADVKLAGTVDVSNHSADFGGRIYVSTDHDLHLGKNGTTTHLRANGTEQAGQVDLNADAVHVDAETHIQTNGIHHENRVHVNANNGIIVHKNLETNAETTLNADNDGDGHGDLSIDHQVYVKTNSNKLVAVANDLHLYGNLDSGTNDTVLSVSDGGDMRIGSGSGNYTVSKNELSRITAKRLLLGNIIDGQGQTGHIVFSGVNVNTNSIADGITAHSDQIKFNNQDSSFTSLRALADSGIEISRNVSTTDGELVLDADNNADGQGTLNITHKSRLSSPKSITLDYADASGVDKLITNTDTLYLQSQHIDPSQTQKQVPESTVPQDHADPHSDEHANTDDSAGSLVPNHSDEHANTDDSAGSLVPNHSDEHASTDDSTGSLVPDHSETASHEEHQAIADHANFYTELTSHEIHASHEEETQVAEKNEAINHPTDIEPAVLSESVLASLDHHDPSIITIDGEIKEISAENLFSKIEENMSESWLRFAGYVRHVLHFS